MEKAIAELKNTIELAREYFGGVEHHVEELESHASALQEDIGYVEKHRTTDKDLEKIATEITIEARRLKRDLDRVSYPMVRLQKAEEDRRRKEMQEEDDKRIRLRLAQIERHDIGEETQENGVMGQVMVCEKRNSRVKIPAIKLPAFTGDVDEYRGFMAAFQDMIKDEHDLTDVKKWLLLKAHLAGKALAMIKELPTAPETYAVAVELLEETFGSKRRAVTSLYQKLQLLDNADMEDDSLRLVQTRMEGILRSLEQLGEDANSNDFLRAVVLSKFPRELTHLLRVSDETSLSVFRKELSAYIRGRETTLSQVRAVKVQVDTKAIPGTSDGGAVKNKKSIENAAFGLSENKTSDKSENTGTSYATIKKPRKKFFIKSPKCIFCLSEHWSDECDVYKTVAQRIKKLGDRCNRCLHPRHEGKTCLKEIKCAHCGEINHHRSLCTKKSATKEVTLHVTEIPLSQTETDDSTVCGFLTFMVNAGNVNKNNEYDNIRAVIDTASKPTLVTQRLAEKLKIKTIPGGEKNLIGVNGIPIKNGPTSAGKLCLYPPGNKNIVLDVLIVDTIAENIIAVSPGEFKNKYPQFKNLTMPDEGNGKEIDLLIGLNSLLQIITLQNSIYVNSKLQLVSTKFGWLAFGSIKNEIGEENSTVATMMLNTLDPIKLMVDLDSVGLTEIEKTQNDEEQIALEKFYAEIKFKEGRYEVAWPWRYDPPELTNNFGLAWGRLKNLHKKLSTNQSLLTAYDRLIREQVELGIIEPVNRIVGEEGDYIHYIAHQAVVKIEKSTPVRIVYDASARATKKDKSLNDNIMKGANWVDKIPALLVRFRRYSTALTADIERAFHQISIKPKDRDVVRFIWLRDPAKPPMKENLQVFRFKRMAFGIVASPFLLYATIRFHISKFPHEFTQILKTDLYADNLVASLPSDVNLASFYTKIKNTFSSMSMNLSKWSSNNKQLLSVVAEADRTNEINQTVLGIRWNTQNDEIGLVYQNELLNSAAPITKRNVLREAAAIYDPLGFVVPTALIARIFIRRLWQENYTWDQPLGTQLAAEWQKIRTIIEQVNSVNLPRKMIQPPSLIEKENSQLHVFVDASVEAYAAVAFIRINSQIAFVMAKTKLTPKTKLSVPKLELIAAVVGARFARHVEEYLQLKNPIKIFLWGDSKCVLSWIHSNKILPAYIQKLVKQIKNLNIDEIRYVPTTMNPADVATRGADITTLKKQNWWSGPNWLRDEEQWPPCTLFPENQTINEIAIKLEENEKILLTNFAVQRKTIDVKMSENTPFSIRPEEFSSLTALLRRSAFLVFVINKIFLARMGRKVILIDHEKINYSFVQQIWIKWDQNRFYNKIPINKKTNISYLRNLKVFQDEHGILRCLTRFHNSYLDYNIEKPILLVKGSPLTQLIILHIHNLNLHAGTAYTLANLRKKYYVPHGRRLVYQIIHTKCAICKKFSAQPFAAPDIAPLPEFRLQKTDTPFKNVGIDVFGPYKIKKFFNNSIIITKVWVIIFTCLVVRAVHLEILQDMTTEEFLHTFRRFVGRRGVPEIIVSDNAPQFYIIQGIFKSLWHTFAEDKTVTAYFAQKEICWKFIPPNAPWMGGVYERLIKTIKIALEKTHPMALFTENQFKTIIVEIEAMMNSRPISYVDKEINTPLITPNHFLMVKYPAIPIDFQEAQPSEQITQLWKAAQQYLEAYWKIWSEQYILALKERRDTMKDPHLTTKRKPKVGEIVLMLDPGTKRSSWRKAIIERLIPSNDNEIRSVQIKMSNGGRMIRPITKLIPLDLIVDLPLIDKAHLNTDKTGLVFVEGESVEQNSE